MSHDSTQSSRKQCPYWGKNNSHECKMTKGGLYIPMPEHINMFCLTSRYTFCHQYIRGCELLREAAKKYGFIVDGGRRRYRRVAERIPVSVSLCDKDRGLIELIDEDAVTIDLSLGGLRLLSRRELPRDSLVSFGFGPDFTIPDLAGIGEVKWCELKSDSPLFEAGLAFSDFRVTQAIGSHLGLPMM